MLPRGQRSPKAARGWQPTMHLKSRGRAVQLRSKTRMMVVRGRRSVASVVLRRRAHVRQRRRPHVRHRRWPRPRRPLMKQRSVGKWGIMGLRRANRRRASRRGAVSRCAVMLRWAMARWRSVGLRCPIGRQRAVKRRNPVRWRCWPVGRRQRYMRRWPTWVRGLPQRRPVVRSKRGRSIRQWSNVWYPPAMG